MAVQHEGVRFGAAYYYEYAGPGDDPRPETLERDLDLMQAAGFSVIRVGESVWSTWEPDEGRFALDWLEPVLDGAHARGIDVVLGTPTYALPMWLVRRYPEVAGELRTGQPMGWGARQETDITHPAFRFHAERVLTKIVERYKDHPAVVGFQVDNEPGLHLLHNRGVFQRFVDELRHTYGDVETLNREWGLVYWSHRLSTWADLWTPDGNAQPQYDLAWRRFQASLTTEMIDWQAKAVRALARPDQWVTTCIAYDRPALEDADLASVLDVTSGNAYYGMQDSLAHPSTHTPAQYWTAYGTWALFQVGDAMFSSRGEPFLVTETNAQAIGGPSTNNPAYPGQWRQSAWALVARGARMVEYWHWRTLHYGAETYWGGVLPHSGVPGRPYREMALLGAELARVGGELADAVPDSDIAILSSTESRFALAAQPPLQKADGTGDPNSYPRIVSAFYRGAFDAGLQVRVVRPRYLFSEDPAAVVGTHPVLVAAGYYPASDADLAWLLRYAEAGGHLVVGPRTGYADHEGRARTEVQPARLSTAAGAWYEEFSNLAEPVPVSGALAGEATAWAECLVADGADVLATYEHPHLGAWAAATTRSHGDGRITVVGTVPGLELARSLADWLVPAPLAGWEDLPPSITVHSSTRPDGTRVHIVHNWSWEAATVTAPTGLDLLVAPRGTAPADPPPADAAGPSVAAGDAITLGSWDVLVAVAR
ncbi:beta-galactosidase [Cellulomonas sp. Root137]|uniref:beta-galactosidase n=1 Tax=Cellulomonas sp. Root137 TaxID=1736459 RepID=UPI0006FCD87D|nr:beta-galactosidase [Cellulomonas sp. Root137]KQY47135.1 beta-galactosidase [Cellulomonas sp. Root137]KRD44279.1 beta-galactosidase [Cellulomonas sp. Root930]